MDLGEQQELVFGTRVSGGQFAINLSESLPPAPQNSDPELYFGGYAANSITATAAVLYRRNKFFAGLTIDNLISKTSKLYGFVSLTGFNDPEYSLILGRDFRLGKKLSSTHSAYIVKVDDFWRFDLNNSFVFNNWLIAGASLEVNNSDADNQIWPKANAGLNVKNKARFIFSVYSEKYNTGGDKFRGQMMMMFNL